MKLKVGDKVIWSTLPKAGVGTIIHIEDIIYSIEWKKNVDGHNCNGLGKQGCCFWAHEGELTLARTNIWQGAKR